MHLQACEHYMSAESVAELVKLKGGAKEILQLETIVLQGLRFDLVVYEPYRCVDAMVQVCVGRIAVVTKHVAAYCVYGILPAF